MGESMNHVKTEMNIHSENLLDKASNEKGGPENIDNAAYFKRISSIFKLAVASSFSMLVKAKL